MTFCARNGIPMDIVNAPWIVRNSDFEIKTRTEQVRRQGNGDKTGSSSQGL